MKITFKKIAASVMAAATLVSMTAITASATEISRKSEGQSFSDDWELYASGPSYTMTYGFNTAFINEDYCWTRSNNTSHTAIVKNSKGQFSDNADKKEWAKIEVTHKGSTITYKMIY